MSRRWMLLVTLAMGSVMPASAAAAPGVGHRVERLSVPGAAPNELRKVDAHLWYPAQVAGQPKTVYTSALFGQALPHGWAPLSWSVEAELAREDAAFDAANGPYTPIVFSHGATNDPIDYAHTLEAIAAAGFVVIAPTHTNNTQDDVRRDYVNALAGTRVFPCEDGLAPRPLPTLGDNGFPSADCAKGSVPNSMSDRVRDVDAVLDALPGWFGNAVDAHQAGVMGHSRGTVTALAVAGGSTTWGTLPEPRVKAIMGMAIGATAINNGVNLAGITVPTLLISGAQDRNTATANTIAAFGQIPATDKTRVEIAKATHRSFDSTYCAQLQSSGAAFDTDHDGVVSAAEATATNRPLDRWNFPLIAASAPGFLSGKAVHYCPASAFTTPVDIRRLVAATDNAEYECTDAGCGWRPHTAGNAAAQVDVCDPGVLAPPCTTLSTDAVKADITSRAVAFFGPRLDVAPPRLTVPADVTVNATSPAGATVHFTATATDAVDQNPSVTCTPPSGSVFAIATTPVRCVATDARENTAEKTFTVTVLGAGAQLANLADEVFGAGNVPAAVKALLHSLDPSRPLQRAAACATLRAFTTIVRLLGPAHGAAWIADANRIRAVLAC